MDTKELRERWASVVRRAVIPELFGPWQIQVAQGIGERAANAILADIEAQGWRVVRATDAALHDGIALCLNEFLEASTADEYAAARQSAREMFKRIGAPQGEKR